MGATHSSSRDLHGSSSGFTMHKGRSSFSKERLRSNSSNSIHTPHSKHNYHHNQHTHHQHHPQMHYPSPNNSASTLNSNHYLSPASPSHNSHPQYRNHHSAPIHSPSSSTHRQGSISPPSSSNASSNTSSTLQKAISRRRASSQTVESNISSSYGSTLASSPDRQHAYLSTRHSGEGSMAGGFGHLEKDDHEFRWYHGRRYHNTPSLYMLPNDTEEVDRLHLQHYIYKMIMGNKNIHVPIPKDCGRVIDLGCGPATWTMDMATDLTSVNFHGVDISPIYPAAIHPRNCSFSRECIISGLSQPSNSFDVAYQRNVAPGFTFEYWSRSITEAFRILKPGGYFESVETDVRVHDAGPMTNACFDHMIMSMASRNIDPSVVRSLDKLMIEAGFVDVRVVEYRVPLGEYGGKLGQLWKQNMTAILETVKPHLAKAGRITDQQVEGMIREMGRETARRGDGEEEFRSFQTVYVTYGRKPL